MKYFTVLADRKTGEWDMKTLTETTERWPRDQRDTDQYHYDECTAGAEMQGWRMNIGEDFAVRVEWTDD